jgi:hypothetical protein
MIDTVERCRTEVNHICRASLATAERHYAAETPWCNTTYWLGIPAIVLSAIAGAAAFYNITNSELLPGSIYILVAILIIFDDIFGSD